MKRSRKYIFLALKVFAALLLLIFLSVFIYVSVNKQKIIAQVTREVATKLNGDLQVGKVELSFFRNFPSVSVLLHDISLTDTMYARHKHIFFKSKALFVNLAVTKLISGKPPLKGLRIDDGELYLFTDTSGYTNTYLLNGKKDSVTNETRTPAGSDLQKVALNNVMVIIDDRKSGKLHQLYVSGLKLDVDDAAKRMLVDAKADILVKNLAFNTDRGSFLKDKKVTGNFELAFDKITKMLIFDSIDIKISGQPFNLTGRFQLAGESPQFSLRLHSRKIKYDFAKAILPAKIAQSLSIVSLDKPLDVDANIYGPLKRGDPFVYATWAVNNTQLLTPFLDFDNASFTGYFTNEVVKGFPRKDPNSKIEIRSFTAGWHDLPIKVGKIEILNLTFPELTCDLSTDFALTKLNELIGSSSLRLLDGQGSVRLNYKGPIEKNNNFNSFLNGEIVFKNGTLLYAPRDVHMKNLTARMVFKNSDVIVEKLQALVLGQQIQMDGQAKNLLTLINTEPDKANIDWNVYSANFNLEPFTFLLGTRKKSTAQKDTRGMAGVATKIDDLLERGRLHVNLKAGILKYKKFLANNAVADVTLLQDRYLINNVAMQHAGGQMSLNGSVVSQGANHQANLLVNMNSVDVSRMLQAFDNFGQDAITSQNLEGKFTTKVNASMLIDGNGKVVPNSIASVINFSLKNGALNNYEPVKKIQRFVFKNRDFENIRFAELKNTMVVKNQEITINRMEIQSSVLSMYVEGLYSRRGNTDMSIQVPLSNLKKRSEDFNPENLGSQKKGGGSIYIRGRPGPDGNIKFKLDLFNKFNKEKDKNKPAG
ncbi:MAG: AsmA-like C-terminal region-containing protein, partial [Ferruginibacter sp.]